MPEIQRLVHVRMYVYTCMYILIYIHQTAACLVVYSVCNILITHDVHTRHTRSCIRQHVEYVVVYRMLHVDIDGVISDPLPSAPGARRPTLHRSAPIVWWC